MEILLITLLLSIKVLLHKVLRGNMLVTGQILLVTFKQNKSNSWSNFDANQNCWNDFRRTNKK